MRRLSWTAALLACLSYSGAGSGNDRDLTTPGYRTEVYLRDRAEEVRAALLKSGSVSLEGIQLWAVADKDGSFSRVRFRLHGRVEGQGRLLGKYFDLLDLRAEKTPFEGRALRMTLRKVPAGLGWPPVVMVLEDADLKSTEVAIGAARLSIVIPPLRFPDDR